MVKAAAQGGPNRCVAFVEEAGGCERLEALQLHENAEVYAKAAHLLDTYFGEPEEDASIAPTARSAETSASMARSSSLSTANSQSIPAPSSALMAIGRKAQTCPKASRMGRFFHA